MRKGLTLMELLVVISILATLAALLYPVYLRVQARMDISVCAQQLRQIGLALRIYVHDHGGDTPYNVPPHLGALYPHYVRSRDLLNCPLFRKTAQDALKFLNDLIKEYGSPFPWSSYYLFDPTFIDTCARTSPVLGFDWISFAEVYAKRGDQTPIVYCDTHRYGCPTLAVETLASHSKANLLLPDCRSIGNPNAPFVILRWGGNISFVHRGTRDTSVILASF